MKDQHMPLPVGKLPARFERLALQTHRKWKVPREQARYLYWHMSELLEVSEILQWLLKKDPQDRPFLFYGAMHEDRKSVV